MGTRRKSELSETEYTEKTIQRTLRGNFMTPSSMRYQLENLQVYDWESDFLSVTKAGYVYECEIKISRSDFFNDKKKERKHHILEGTYVPKDSWEEPNPSRPNYFYYAVPENLVKVEEVPEYAGLLYIVDRWPYVQTVKAAPQLHKEKIDEDYLRLKEKFYYNYVAWKDKAEREYGNTIDKLRRQLVEARVDEDGKKYKYTIGEANQKVKELEILLSTKEEQYNRLTRAFNQECDYSSKLKDMLIERGVPRKEIRKMLMDIINEES